MTRQEFISFLKKFRADYHKNPDRWENKTLDDFLEAMQAYTEDIQGYYDNTKQNINADKFDYKVFSDILEGAAIYE